MWAHFDGTARTLQESLDHLAALKWTDWNPVGITLHNTAAPTLAQWAESGPSHDARIRNLENYYENELGWHAGPHWFISRTRINWFSNPLLPGVHSRCFNATRLSIEMVGDYAREPFNSGDGALVRDLSIAWIAVLNKRFGFKADGLTFHKECTRDNHDCPGRLVDKSDVIARVRAAMAGGVPVIGTGRAPDAPAPTPAPTPAPPKPPASAAPLPARIAALAAASDLARVNWRNRGRAPVGYTKGMAAVFAKVYADLKTSGPAATVMAQANTDDDNRDAISWYDSNFRALGMTNDKAGADTLRHLFVLLTGLGMRESSGQYFEGRDMSATNVSADTAEAGLFQQSWNSHSASPELSKLLAMYSTVAGDGMLPIFREGVTARVSSNYGLGDGLQFQKLCKEKPAFAVECAAVGLRTIRRHWGPVNRKEAELRPEADALFKQVQALVDAQ